MYENLPLREKRGNCNDKRDIGIGKERREDNVVPLKRVKTVSD